MLSISTTSGGQSLPFATVTSTGTLEPLRVQMRAGLPPRCPQVLDAQGVLLTGMQRFFYAVSRVAVASGKP